VEKILEKSDITHGKHSAENTIYGKDPAKIKHLWKIFYKNQTSSIEKILYKESPSMEKILRK
jgi:hypothetical protein